MASPQRKIKVLACGPVLGRFAHLSAKLNSLQRGKAGPFDVCFCVGPFFGGGACAVSGEGDGGGDGDGDGDGDESSKLGAEAGDLLAGKIELPMPVYFADVGRVPKGLTIPERRPPVGARDEDEIDLDDDDSPNKTSADANGGASANGVDGDGDGDGGTDSEVDPALDEFCTRVAPNAYRLDGGAVAVAAAGGSSSSSGDIVSLPVRSPTVGDAPAEKIGELVVAFLPPNARYHGGGTVAAASTPPPPIEAKAGSVSYVGCDVLLSSEWGQGMASSATFLPADKERLKNQCPDVPPSEMGSYDVAEIASLVRPRYHFAPSSERVGYHHFASAPYHNVPSSQSASSMGREQFHVSRFVALGNVLDAREAKAAGKTRKFMHAVGIHPLLEMDRASLLEVPAGAVPSPYTDESYGAEPPGGPSGGAVGRRQGYHIHQPPGGGLCEARARRVMMEEDPSLGGGGGRNQQQQQQFRWAGRGVSNSATGGMSRKRPRDEYEERSLQERYGSDPSNRCLFVHGLDKDPGDLINLGTLLEALGPHGCTKVRIPPAGRKGKSSYGFLEFGTHGEAETCLRETGGDIVVSGVHLGLRWSSGGSAGVGGGSDGRGGERNRADGGHGIPPPPPPPMPTSSMTQNKRAKNRLTEAEASDSDSLYVALPKRLVVVEDFPAHLESIRALAERCLEDVINGDGTGGDRITAKDDPALAVSVRHPDPSKAYGFLGFASHAAASTAITALTGGLQDGGNIPSEALGNELAEQLLGVALFWAKGTSKAKQSHHSAAEDGNDNRLTEAEASDSDSLYVTLPKRLVVVEDFPARLESIRALAERCLEDAINGDDTVGDRITAKDDSALAVSLRHPDPLKAYGFLGFASHAAASTAITALTGGLQDGGNIPSEALGNELAEQLLGVALFWARGTAKARQAHHSTVEDGNDNKSMRFQKRHFPKDSRKDCWFCLASPTCERHLIVGVNNGCYVTMPKGPLNDHHSLIVPVEHGSEGALCGSVADEIDDVKMRLRRHAREELGKELFVFERAIQTKGGYHTHVQCVPLEPDSAKALCGTLMSMSKDSGFALKEVNSDLSLKAMGIATDGDDDGVSGYFYAEVPLVSSEGSYRRFVFKAESGNGGNAVPLQFGREVAAVVSNKPERTDWKACVQDEAKEIELANAFKESFAKFNAD